MSPEHVEIVRPPGGSVQRVILPDAEHIHLTRLPDGSWRAVEMDFYGLTPPLGHERHRLWVDVEEAGA